MKFKLLLGLVFLMCIGLVSAASPVMVSSTIDPIIAYENSDLLGYCNASDLDGNNLTYYYQWWNGTTLYELGNESAVGVTNNNGIISINNNIFNSNFTSYISMAELSDGRLAVAYRDYDNSGTFSICNSTGSDCTDSIFNSNSTSYISMTELSDGRLAVAYMDFDNSQYGTFSICNSTGGDCTKSIFNSNSTSFISMTELSDGRLAVAYRDTFNSEEGTFSICNSTGGDCTKSVFNFAPSYYNSMTELSDGRLAVAYMDTGILFDPAYSGNIAICNSTGGNCTENVFNPSILNYISLTELSDGSLVIAYQDGGNSQYGTFSICNSTGGDCTDSIFNSNSTSYISMTELSDNRLAVAYRDYDNSGTFSICNSTGGDCTKSFFNSNSSSFISLTELSDGRLAVAYKDYDNSGSLAITNYLSGNFYESTEYLINILSSLYLTEDEIWTLSCLANDGTTNSSWLNSSSVTILSNINLTKSYDEYILEGFGNELFLNVTYIDLIYDSSFNLPSAILKWNHTNYTANLLTYNTTFARFNYTITSDFDLLTYTNITHQWYFNLSKLDNKTFIANTNNTNQTLYPILVSKCNATTKYPIYNFSYFDDSTTASITLENGYNLKITDGTYYYNQTNSFTGNTYDTLCTNLPPTILPYNWNAWGTFTLSKALYATRIITSDAAFPTLISNNPFTQLDMSLILLNESTTIQYTWLGSDNSLIDGIMRIYKCNANGTETLIESVPIVNGNAIANIELLTQPYRYEVIIDGTVYSDTSFSVCHVEAASEITYFIDITEDILSPVIGLFLIDCELTKPTNSTVKMTWDSNPDSTSNIEGCIIGYRQTIDDFYEVYRNCTNSTSYTYTVSVPDTNNIYLVRGEITQDGVTGYCSQEFTFGADKPASVKFGLSGVLATIILILGLALFYAGDSVIQIVGAMIGLIVAWIIGIVNFDWQIVSAIIAFLIVIITIARYGREK